MPTSSFKVVLLEHGYHSTEPEKSIITRAGGEFIDAEHLPLPKALELCRDAEAVMCRRAEITADMIRTFSRCRILLRYGVGTDNIDVEAATAADILVGHVPVYCVDEVSTHAIALLLGCVRRLVSTHQKMETGGWDLHREEPIHRLAGRTLGLVGLGHIGKAVANKLAGWNLRILAADPFVEPEQAGQRNIQLVDLPTLCRESDFLSLHCPLLPETRHLLNATTLSWCRHGAILINTARGPLVDTQALIEALNQGRLAQAGLDVFEDEPLPVHSPLHHQANLLLSDHTAWYSEQSQKDLQTKAAEEVVRVCTGHLPHSLVNPELLQRRGIFSQWTVPEHVAWQIQRLKRLSARSV
jgi:D-3-phosphoglycerate dehydrogenase